MSNPDNPTGEWTESDITKICDELPTFWQTALTNRINSAIAAERKRCDPNEFEKQAQVAVAHYEKVNQQLQEQLDSEREFADIGRKWREDSSLESWFPVTAKEIQQLREQLATVRELREHDQKQLAAEREKLAERHKLCVDYETKWKAEREKSRVLGNMIDGVNGQPGLRQQLAAERENTRIAQQGARRQLEETLQLRKQVAAAVEALKRLRDCDFVITLPDRMDAVREIADAALEKIGEL